MGDITATTLTGTGTVRAGRARVVGAVLRSTATAGTVVFKDGGSGGATIMTLQTPAGVGLHPIDIPYDGVLFSTDVHATLSNVDGLVVFSVG